MFISGDSDDGDDNAGLSVTFSVAFALEGERQSSEEHIHEGINHNKKTTRGNGNLSSRTRDDRVDDEASSMLDEQHICAGATTH